MFVFKNLQCSHSQEALNRVKGKKRRRRRYPRVGDNMRIQIFCHQTSPRRRSYRRRRILTAGGFLQKFSDEHRAKTRQMRADCSLLRWNNKREWNFQSRRCIGRRNQRNQENFVRSEFDRRIKLKASDSI
jgi:hypothetical protein